MARTTTTVVGVGNYGAGTDPFRRVDYNADMAAIEAFGARVSGFAFGEKWRDG